MSKPRKLKMWGGDARVKSLSQSWGRDARMLVVETSQKKAVEALNKRRGGYTSLNHFRDYWCETGNALELALLKTAKAGQVFYGEPHANNPNYKELLPGEDMVLP